MFFSTPARRRALFTFVLLVHLIPPLLFLKAVPVVLDTGADFATYYYAERQAVEGGSPYDLQALTRRTHKPVLPYLYPPPFLLLMVWTLPLTLAQAFLVMFAINEALLMAVLYVLWRAFKVAAWVPVLILGTFFPLWDNLLWGQANLIILAPALGAMALAKKRPAAAGALIGLAIMLKPTPIVFLLFWLVRGQMRPLLAAFAVCVGLTVLSLPLVGPSHQIAYFVHGLPGLWTGANIDQNIALSASQNHSIAGVLSRIWPGPIPVQPSTLVQSLRVALGVGLLGGAWAATRQVDRPESTLAALLGVVTLLPVYAWEHHLLLVLPALALASVGRRGWRFWVAYACMAWPLGLVAGFAGLLPPALHAAFPWLSVTKLAGVLGMVALCVKKARTPAIEPVPLRVESAVAAS
jgi:alpha-1,2-mannosyltransferase